MGHGNVPPDDDSASSSFSSDDNVEDKSALESVAFYSPRVHVYEHEDAAKQDDVPWDSTSRDASVDVDHEASLSVQPCCQAIANATLETLPRTNVPYEHFTAAIEHVTTHWPGDEDTGASEPTRAQAYHRLRSRLYRGFHDAFPLTEDMYVQWMQDARALEASREELLSLVKQSHGDYWSVPLTLESLELVKDTGDARALANAMAWTQSTLGLHFTRGHEIWARCRDLVAQQYDAMAHRDDAAREKEGAIRDLFARQLQLPLEQNDLVLSECRAWAAYNTLDAAASESLVQKASTWQTNVVAPFMNKMRAFETNVTAAVEDPVACERAWLQYVNFVTHRVAPVLAKDEATGTKARQVVVCLYERAVAGLCLSATLWKKYLEYVEAHADRGDKLAVAERARRNVPFDSSFWIDVLLEMEAMGTSVDERSHFMRTELLARATSPMDACHLLHVLLTWCDSIRRHVAMRSEHEFHRLDAVLGSVFADAQAFLARVFPDCIQGHVQLVQYQAKCYWTLLPSEDPARVATVCHVWNTMLEQPLGTHAALWLAYLASLERMNTFSSDELRAMVFDKARERCDEFPLALAEAWLVFEREQGNLASYQRARRYYAKHYAAAQAKAAASAGAATNVAPRDEKASARGKKRKAPTTTAERQKRRKADATETKQPRARTFRDDHTLFLCPVPKEATKDEITAIFRDIPSFQDARLVVKTRGKRHKSRGMAYVQFTDEAGVTAGLAKRGVLLHGLPVPIERSKPPATSALNALPSDQQAGPGAATTLYVGNLNRPESTAQVTEAQLEASLHDAMASVRANVSVQRVLIVRDRQHKLKNHALVQVADPSHVQLCIKHAAAVQAKVGPQVTLRPARASIAHVLAQEQKQRKTRSQRVPPTRPTTRLALASTATTTSFVPRALCRKAQGKETTSNMPVDGIMTPKSNDEFREMISRK
ncbi:hypothetical protein PsorP6_015394 [Peronosclerospora sorghi]|uniref:Uncharacterized protein n=1 Tax=Peronosclerospora sorghi TaxID=230839 RepID=A0ACC0WP16_9STRA|nr:hypothetical protein PsorP6_015394 [Peronosclerospora sorghi]